MDEAAIETHIEGGIDSLAAEFAGIFSREIVEHYVRESVDSLSDARVREFIPVLVHRSARERLKALATQA